MVHRRRRGRSASSYSSKRFERRRARRQRSRTNNGSRYRERKRRKSSRTRSTSNNIDKRDFRISDSRQAHPSRGRSRSNTRHQLGSASPWQSAVQDHDHPTQPERGIDNRLLGEVATQTIESRARIATNPSRQSSDTAAKTVTTTNQNVTEIKVIEDKPGALQSCSKQRVSTNCVIAEPKSWYDQILQQEAAKSQIGTVHSVGTVKYERKGNHSLGHTLVPKKEPDELESMFWACPKCNKSNYRTNLACDSCKAMRRMI